MADMTRVRVLVCFTLLSHVTVFAWDAVDFELFDLVEEVKTNFYDVLGVSQVGCFIFNFLAHSDCIMYSILMMIMIHCIN